MSKIIYVCYKNRLNPPNIEESMRCVCNEISPDNIAPNPPKISRSEGIAYGIVNPVDSVLEHENSVLLGCLLSEKYPWWEAKKEDLDGSYVIIQAGNDSINLISDIVGSRTIWYYKDDEVFIASTSQRAITMLICSFEFNQEVIPWFMSTGSMGLSNSWDKRFKIVPPDTTIVLDRHKWTISKQKNRVEFINDQKDGQSSETRLIEILKKTLKETRLDYSKWVLPLSGGYDSRGILYFINREDADNQKLITITWGLEHSLDQKGNDAYVAKKLAEYVQLPHNYYFTDVGEEPIEKIVERFIINGEGRIDHISGYMDGFNIFKKLFEDGVEGIIRGDEGFGWVPVNSSIQARISTGLGVCSDFENLKDYEKYGFHKQTIPEILDKGDDETLAAYRDRLYHEYRIPTILSSLTDLKTPYIEVLNPLLSRKIIEEIRRTPDRLRTDKRLYKDIVTKSMPKIGFAKYGANKSRGDILKNDAIVDLMESELSSMNTKTVLPPEFVKYVLKNVKTQEFSNSKREKPSVFKFAIRIAPKRIKSWFVGTSRMNVDWNVLAFRMYIVVKMNGVLNDDASLLETTCK